MLHRAVELRLERGSDEDDEKMVTTGDEILSSAAFKRSLQRAIEGLGLSEEDADHIFPYAEA